MFKVGDMVECIDNTNIPLTLYQEYIVVEGGSMGITVVDDSGYRSYLRHARFRPVSKKTGWEQIREAANKIVNKELKCNCGSEIAGAIGHSDWCDKK